MMRWLWLLFLLVGMGSARADVPRWEDLPLPTLNQALVDTTGTLRPDTFEEVNQLAAGLSTRGQARMVVVVLPRASEGLEVLARELYDSWQVAGDNDKGAVFVIALEDRTVRFESSWVLGTTEEVQAVRESAEQAMRAQTDPDGAVRAAARVFSEWMEKAATHLKEVEVRTTLEPFAAFLQRPHLHVADPDRLLTPELTRKARQSIGTSDRFLVVYDRARHPVEAHELAGYLSEEWTRSSWLVVISTQPVEVSIVPPRDYSSTGGYRRGIPKAAMQWKEAVEQLGRDPSSPATAAAWDKALEQTKSIDGSGNPSWEEQKPSEAGSSSKSAGLFALLITVGLFVLVRMTIWKLEDAKGPHDIRVVIVCGLLYTVVYGCALGWVREQSALLGIFGTFFNFPWVFIGVRRFCAWCDFNPFYYVGSWCPLMGLGLFFSLVAFSSELFLVGPWVRTVELRELQQTAGGAYHLRGATLRHDYSSSHDVERESIGLESAQLAPLVTEGWTPDQPVPAWLLCRHHENYEEECAWDGPITDAVAPTSLGITDTRRLIQRAEYVTALRSAPGARLLSRTDDAGAAVAGVLLRALLLPLLFVGAFVVLAIHGERWDEAKGVERPSQMSTSRRRKSKKKARK
jgi:hypothetical protein